MTDNRPTRLDDYCRQNNISFFDLKIPCLFCRFDLTLQELAAFFTKNLALVYKEGDKCYGLCFRCTRVSARHEAEHYLRCIVKSDFVDVLAECPLIALTIRCIECYKQLDAAEKLDIRARSEDLYLVRKHWRGYCRECYKR